MSVAERALLDYVAKVSVLCCPARTRRLYQDQFEPQPTVGLVLVIGIRELAVRFMDGRMI